MAPFPVAQTVVSLLQGARPSRYFPSLPLLPYSRNPARRFGTRAFMDDVQGGILSAQGRGRWLGLWFFRFTDPADTAGNARRLGELAAAERGFITTAWSQYRTVGRRDDSRPFRSLALTGTGLAACGAADPAVFPESLLKGMAAEAGFRLGDPTADDGSLSTWRAPYLERIDGVWLLGHRSEREVEGLFAEMDGMPGVRRVHTEQGRIWQRGLGPAREPFGYADGISVQRFFSGRPPLDTALDQVFGQDELHGGSFLVFRKLEQNVRLFREYRAEMERLHGAEAARRLADGLVGRQESGRPLTAHRGFNRFDFADDQEGRRCPFHAHIRRSNPRAVRNDGGPDLRLVRRGVVYGSDGDLEDDAGATGDVGLLFLAYMHSLDTFRTMQGNWLAYAHFPIRERTTPPDGIIHGPPADWRPYDPAQRFVTPRGGSYFFVPGLRWLRALAGPGNAV